MTIPDHIITPMELRRNTGERGSRKFVAYKGITAKLDYLKDLGIDALWLSPHFPSPNWDCGYDISDYQNVAPEYGMLDDFKRFLAEAHERNIRVILDLV